MFVYFTGASGTGKSTLAKHVSEAYGIPILTSAARAALGDMGLPPDGFAKLMQDKEKFKAYQQAVRQKQITMEEMAAKLGPFISERMFDNLAYSALYGWDAPQAMEALKPYAAKFNDKGHKYIVFFVKPTRECLEAANAGADRKEFLVWDDMLRFDGALQLVMECLDIPYIRVSSPDMRERVKTIESVLDWFCPRKSVREELKRAMISHRSITGPPKVTKGDRRFDYVKGVDPEGKPTLHLINEVIHRMNAWMKDSGTMLMEINMGHITPDCPLAYFKLDNYGMNAVLDRMHGRPANPSNYRRIIVPPGTITEQDIKSAVEDMEGDK